MTQTSLIDALEQQTDRAVHYAGAFAEPEWYRAAEYALEVLIRRGNNFTTDELHKELQNYEVSTHEPRALGAIIRQASKNGLIRSTGQFKKSTRPECHRRPVSIWAVTTKGYSYDDM